jgi:hypothetical protein
VASFELLSSGPATRPRRTMTVARLDESTIRSAQTPGRGRRLLSHGTRVLRRRSSETVRSRRSRQNAWTRLGRPSKARYRSPVVASFHRVTVKSPAARIIPTVGLLPRRAKTTRPAPDVGGSSPVTVSRASQIASPEPVAEWAQMGLFHLDVGRPYYLGPFRGFIGDKPSEFCR